MAKKYIDESGLLAVFAKIKALIATKANATHSHDAATQSAAGFMSAADKKKLDGVASGANSITVDSGLSSTSTNPVQNKVINSALAGKAASSHGHSNATTGAAGFMSASDKSKLDGIASGANAYTHPTTSGNKHIPSGGASGKILKWASDGTATWGDEKDTVYTHPSYTARTGVPTADQTPGFGGSFNVTQPVSDAAGHITAMNSRKVTIPNTAATQSAAGLMSAADKQKLDGMASGANAYTHPTTSGNKHIPAGGSSGQILRWSSDGTAEWGADNNSDTKNTAGTTNKTGTKLFLAGATSQASNPQTYSNSNVYVTTDNGLAAKEFYRDGLAATRVFGTLIPYGTTVAANSNLNTTDFLKVGNYFCSANATVATLTNCPTTSAFMMQVLSPLSTTIDNETTKTWVYRLRKMQVYTGEEYIQYCYAGATAGSWTYGPWKKVLDSGDVTAATTAEIDTALAAVE